MNIARFGLRSVWRDALKIHEALGGRRQGISGTPAAVWGIRLALAGAGGEKIRQLGRFGVGGGRVCTDA